MPSIIAFATIYDTGEAVSPSQFGTLLTDRFSLTLLPVWLYNALSDSLAALTIINLPTLTFGRPDLTLTYLYQPTFGVRFS